MTTVAIKEKDKIILVEVPEESYDYGFNNARGLNERKSTSWKLHFNTLAQSRTGRKTYCPESHARLPFSVPISARGNGYNRRGLGLYHGKD